MQQIINAIFRNKNALIYLLLLLFAFVFLNNFFLAMLCRLAPNMNVFFSVGFLVSMIGGMILFAMLMPAMFTLILEYCDEALNLIPIMLDAITIKEG